MRYLASLIKLVPFTFLFFAPQLSADKTLTFVANNWCPQHCLNTHKPGYIVELVQAAVDSQGEVAEIQFVPWARAVRMASNGKADGLLTIASSEQKHLIRHQQAIGQQRFCFYSAKNKSISLNKISDFQNRSIAFVKGNDFGEELMNFLNNPDHNVRIEYLTSTNNDYPPQAFKFLLNARVEAIALTEDMAEHYLGSREKISQQVEKKYCTGTENLYIGISPFDPERAKYVSNMIDKGLKEIINNGTYNKILKRYYLPNLMN